MYLERINYPIELLFFYAYLSGLSTTATPLNDKVNYGIIYFRQIPAHTKQPF